MLSLLLATPGCLALLVLASVARVRALTPLEASRARR